jgi:hypothetical protein
VYNETTGALNNHEGLTPEIRNRYENISSTMVSSELENKRPWLSCL